KGEWINTSTYIFYPQPALAGGVSYRMTINPKLSSTNGTPLETTPDRSFTTILPRLVSISPLDNAYHVRLDASVKVNFSYSMDATSVESNFSLTTPDGDQVDGKSGWNDDFTTFAFTPTANLQRDTRYNVLLSPEAAALGGTPLGEEISVRWFTLSELTISGSQPSEGGVKANYDSVRLALTSLVDTNKIEDYLSFTPSVPNLGAYMDEEQMVLNIYGSFDPAITYSLIVSPDLTDLWGSRLGQPYVLHFVSAALDPSVQFPYNADSTFLTTKDDGVLAQVTNLSEIPISVGSMTIDDLVQLYGNNGNQYRQTFSPADAVSWTFHPQVPRNQSTTVSIPIQPDGQPGTPGLYFMQLDIPDNAGFTSNVVLAISHYQATLKLSPSEALVWAVDLDTNLPAVDLPVTVYDTSGQVLASGATDFSGVFQSEITASQDPYNTSFAVLGQLGEDNFGFATSNWSDGINPWDFGLRVNYFPSGLVDYIYTDRPIYRPGDTIHFRLILRQASNGRYTLPDIGSYKLVLNDPMGLQHASFDLSLSAFGSVNGEYTLPSDAQPGNYGLINPDNYSGIYFQVADYRKPEINLQVAFKDTDVISGTTLAAQVSARYFFDAPAGNMPLHWV
ncbi:MAG TPA: Ig-like domain-containing protein, partial [Anaerolineales bacterium]